MSACQPIHTPLEEKVNLCIEPDQVPADKRRYQRLVGRLMYLSHTRPDLAYALSVVSQFMRNPDYRKVVAYTDSDYAGEIDGRRSTAGYFTFVGGNLVTWRSKKQNIVTRSSAQAEFRGMSDGICETLWLRLLLKDLGVPLKDPITLYCDNKAARDIAHNPV
ncbi:uncharacterized protein LOC113315682 [Papaver somniferum]|uniref:uncharacterized protein LOC113315682 n=1 Tax=Papaver somniferum TaxID=3469 RepID=UPI000E6FB505|nr:uncharacterized protein LOC113315682 [Papaver somniferum]